MIDQNARNTLQNMQMVKSVTESIDKLSTAVKSGAGDGNGSSSYVLANEFNALRKVLSEEALTKIKALVEDLNSKIAELNKVSANVPRAIEMNFPKEYPVRGKVDIGSIDRLPSVTVSNLAELGNQIKAMVTTLNNSQVGLVKAIAATADKKTAITGPMEIKGISDLIDGIEQLKNGFNLLLKKDFGTGGVGVQQVELTNFRQLVPQPVTNININPLKGSTLSTAVTVGATATPLPATPLTYRRSIVLYNNGSVTAYIGGAAVTSSNGMPLAAGTFGPAIDAGVAMIVYGITASSTTDIRVLELSGAGEGG